jgi:hypothetical protein
MTKFFETMKETESLTNNSCLQQITEKLPVCYKQKNIKKYFFFFLNKKDMIEFYHASMRRLDSGLYVTYLKMQNSVDCVRVMVNRYMPGSLPCTKIRSVANVSK